MANTLRFKRGLVATIPTALAGEPLFTTDTFDLYIGNGTGNTRFQKYIASGTTSQLLRGDGSLLTMPIVLTSPATGQVLKFNGTNWVNDSDSGITGSGSAGQVAYFTGATTQAGSNNLFWDNTNNRLTIGAAFAGTQQNFNVYSGALFQQAVGDDNKIYIGNNASLATGDGRLLITPFRIKLNTSTGTLIISADNLNTGASISLNARNTDSGSLSLVANNSEAFKIFGATRNVAIQNGGTFTDSGQRLQVTGDTLLRGSGATTATTALQVQNSGSNDLLNIRNDGSIFLTSNTGARIYPSIAISGVEIGATGLAFDGRAVTRTAASSSFWFFVSNNSTAAAHSLMNFGGGFTPTSGTATWNSTLINTTINQTGGANGITRGLYVNPTLTAAADWRSIEWSNNTGWGLFGAGTSNNYLGGSLGIGTTALTGYNVRVNRGITGATVAYGITSDGTIQSDVTSSGLYFSTLATTQNTTFTLNNLFHFSARQSTFGASSTVTKQVGFFVESSLVSAGTNVGFESNIAAASGRWNFYASGTALNYLNGSLLIGSTTDGGERLQVTGTARITDSATFTKVYSNTSDLGVIVSATIPGINLRTISTGRTSFIQSYNSNGTSSILVGTGSNNPTTTVMTFNGNDGTVNVGSWVASTGELLQVQGTAKITGALSAVGTFNLQRSGSGADTTIQFRNEVATNRAKIVFGGTNEELGFYAGGGATENLRIASSGIATFSNKIITQSGSDAIEIGTPTGNNYRSNIYIKATDGSAGAVNAYFGVNVFSTTGILDISNTNGISMRSGGSERLSIASTGGITIGGNLTVDTNTFFVNATLNRVGIGTASPTVPLDVVGDARFSSTIAVGGTATFLNPSSVNIVGTATLVGATARNTSSASGDTQCGFYVENGTSNGQLYKAGTGYTTRKTIAANDLGFYNAAAGNISILNDFASGSIILTAGGSSTAQWTIGANGDLTAADGENIIVGSTNGTKIGTATTQKIGFWNATPIAQPNTSVASANHVSGIGTAVTTFDIFDGYTIGQVVKALRNAGILS